MKTSSQRAHIKLMLLLLASTLSTGIYAAETRTPEEIVITAEPGRPTLEALAFAAEQKFYALYNELNDDDDYDMECHREQTTGSLISAVSCRPNYASKLVSLYKKGGPAGDMVPEAVLRKYGEELQRRVLQLVEENAELRQVLTEQNELVRKLAANQEASE